MRAIAGSIVILAGSLLCSSTIIGYVTVTNQKVQSALKYSAWGGALMIAAGVIATAAGFVDSSNKRGREST